MSYDFYEEDDTAELAPLKAKRHWGMILLGVAMAVVLVGCGVMATMLKGKGQDKNPVAAAPKESKDWATPVQSAAPGVPTTEAPAALASSGPAKVPTTTKPPPSKKPTIVLTTQAPAPKHSTPAGCTPSRGPNQLAKADVRDLLDTAAGTAFWGTATKAEYADIRVPARLLYAIAEQESGWQSDIKACDGGLGLMQIMPTTQTFVNNRFGKSWDRTKPSGNVMCGANYLAWLIAYYGDKIAVKNNADANYDIATNAELLKPVISAYNWGTVGVEPGGPYPNGTYVQNVVALMDHSRAGNY
ncbi:transglycosylase SLT domain-containing protein [Dactylosporangium salmoneum]|uniref:Transglycosylase SLT domain-containing protein n=1 Tax=Dactylosporangium salmoneum TaxID=53361 RepID=A0ABN3H700_9ACTN